MSLARGPEARGFQANSVYGGIDCVIGGGQPHQWLKEAERSNGYEQLAENIKAKVGTHLRGAEVIIYLKGVGISLIRLKPGEHRAVTTNVTFVHHAT